MSATEINCRQASAGEDKQWEGREVRRTDEGEIFKRTEFAKLVFHSRRKNYTPCPSCLPAFFLLPSLCPSFPA